MRATHTFKILREIAASQASLRLIRGTLASRRATEPNPPRMIYWQGEL